MELRATLVLTPQRCWVCLQTGARIKGSGQLYLHTDERPVRKIITLFGNQRRAEQAVEPDRLLHVHWPQPKGTAIPLGPKKARVNTDAMELDGSSPPPDVAAAPTDEPEMTSDDWKKVAKEYVTLDDGAHVLLDVDRDLPDVELPLSGGNLCALRLCVTRRQIDTWIMKNLVGMGHVHLANAASFAKCGRCAGPCHVCKGTG